MTGIENNWRTSVLIVLGLVSIVPVHLAAFSLALPSDFRILLDASFKFSFSYIFLCYAVFSGLVARYMPVIIFGWLGFIHTMSVDKKYYQRGYRRVYVSFTGTGKRARAYKNTEDIMENLSRSRNFGRNEARLHNFKKKKFQSIYPVKFYEDHRWATTLLISICIFSVLYIGVFRSFVMAGVLSIAFIGLLTYGSVATPFRFRLQRNLWKIGEETYNRTVDFDDVLNLVTIVALAASISGYMRVGYLSSVVADGGIIDIGTPSSAIAAVSSGVIVYDASFGVYRFVPWGSFANSERIP